MTLDAATTLRLLLAAGLCGVIGTWILGLGLHLGDARWLKDRRRRKLRLLVAIPSVYAASTLTRALTSDNRFAASLAGKLQDELRAELIWREHAEWPPVSLTAHFDDLGAETQMQLRFDFTNVVSHFLLRSRLFLLVAWPLVFVFVTGIVGGAVLLGLAPSPWFALFELAAALPLAFQSVRRGALRRRFEALGELLIELTEELRAIRVEAL